MTTATTERNYVEEFREYALEHRPDGDYILSVFAAELVETLRRENPGLLQGWLDALAIHFVTDYLGTIRRSERSSQRAHQGAADFAEWQARFESGETTSPFELEFVVADNFIRRRLRDMTKTDHLYVAEQHDARSKAALFEAAVHRAMAAKIPVGKTTADVFSEAEYLRLRASIGAQAAA